MLNDPYPSDVPNSTWPVAGALTVHVIVAPACVMPDAPTALMTSGVLAWAVGVGIDVGVGAGVRVGHGLERSTWLDAALVAMNGIARAPMPRIMMPVAIQSRARRR